MSRIRRVAWMAAGLSITLLITPAVARSGTDCTPHPPISIVGDEGPQGFVLGSDPVSGDPLYRQGSGVSSGTGTVEDPYLIEGLCLTSPPMDVALGLEETSAHVLIRGNVFDGIHPMAHGTGVLVSGSANVRIEDNTFQSLGWGIDLASSEDSSVIGNRVTKSGDHLQLSYQGGAVRLVGSGGVLIEENVITGNNMQAITLESSSDNIVRSNTIAGNQAGPYLTRSDDNLLEGNTITDNGRRGIRISSSTGNVVRSNTISGTTGSDQVVSSAISMWSGGTDTLIEGNTLVDNSGHGIEVAAVSGIVVRDNTLARNGRDGLVVADASGTLVENNRIEGNGGHGARLSRSTDAVVEGNTVLASGGHGVILQGPADTRGDNILRANVVSDNRGAGVLVSGSGGNLLRGNAFERNSWGVALVNTTDDVVEDNTIRDNGVDGVHVWSAAGNAIVRNTVAGNALSGVRLLEASQDNLVEGNVISGNGPAGIRLSSSDGNVIEANIVTRNVHGLTISESETNAIGDNDISGNEKSGMRVFDVSDPVEARSNWWGCAEGPDHPSCDRVIGSVLYQPWLTEPIPEAS